MRANFNFINIGNLETILGCYLALVLAHYLFGKGGSTGISARVERSLYLKY